MRLRARLALTSLIVLVPLALLLWAVADRSRHAAMDEAVQRVVATHLAARLDLCGRTAPRTRAPRPDPVEFLGYKADFTPLQQGPPLPPGARASLSEGRGWVGAFPTPLGRGVGRAFAAPPGARCAYVLAFMGPRPGVRRDQSVALALSLVTVLAATWIAAGPVLARLQRLAREVARSAASQYAEPIEVPPWRDEAADLARAFNQAGASVRAHLLQVQARGDTLRDFVANTTHDMAMPLSALQGHLSTLAAQPTLPGDARDAVRHAVREAHYMGSLLRNLGTAARLDGARPIDRHSVDLAALVERIVARHQVLARTCAVSLDFAVPAEPTWLVTDLTLLEQALGNLVDNAIQYNQPGGHVAVVLDVETRRFILTVLDDGPGIAPQDRERLLAPRARGTDARTRRPDGQGLGLAIVNEAVHALGLSLVFAHPSAGGLRVELSGPMGSCPPPPGDLHPVDPSSD